LPERFPNTALDAVALNRERSVPARYQHAEPRAASLAARQVEGIPRETTARTLSQQVLELGFSPQPPRRIQPEALGGRGYSPMRRRPRARRLRSTLRPPGVRLRTRKP